MGGLLESPRSGNAFVEPSWRLMVAPAPHCVRNPWWLPSLVATTHEITGGCHPQGEQTDDHDHIYSVFFIGKRGFDFLNLASYKVYFLSIVNMFSRTFPQQVVHTFSFAKIFSCKSFFVSQGGVINIDVWCNFGTKDQETLSPRCP